MKKIFLFLLLATASPLLNSCSSKGSDPTPAPTPTPSTGYSSTTGTLTIKPYGASAYTVSPLTVKIEAIQQAAGGTYFQYSYRGKNSGGTYSQVEIYITQPAPLSGSGPWSQSTTVYSTNSAYSSLSLVGYAYGTFSSSNNSSTATFTGGLVSGTLTP